MRNLSWSTLQTCPGAAVQLDSHADGSRVTRVRHEANSSGDDDRSQFVQFGEVRVTVARQQLQSNYIYDNTTQSPTGIHRPRYSNDTNPDSLYAVVATTIQLRVDGRSTKVIKVSDVTQCPLTCQPQ